MVREGRRRRRRRAVRARGAAHAGTRGAEEVEALVRARAAAASALTRPVASFHGRYGAFLHVVVALSSGEECREWLERGIAEACAAAGFSAWQFPGVRDAVSCDIRECICCMFLRGSSRVSGTRARGRALTLCSPPPPVGCVAPEVKLKVERFAVFDRAERAQSEPGDGWVRLYPTGVATYEGVHTCACVGMCVSECVSAEVAAHIATHCALPVRAGAVAPRVRFMPICVCVCVCVCVYVCARARIFVLPHAASPHRRTARARLPMRLWSTSSVVGRRASGRSLGGSLCAKAA